MMSFWINPTFIFAIFCRTVLVKNPLQQLCVVPYEFSKIHKDPYLPILNAITCAIKYLVTIVRSLECIFDWEQGNQHCHWSSCHSMRMQITLFCVRHFHICHSMWARWPKALVYSFRVCTICLLDTIEDLNFIFRIQTSLTKWTQNQPDPNRSDRVRNNSEWFYEKQNESKVVKLNLIFLTFHEM